MQIINKLYHALAVTLLVGASISVYAQGSGNQDIEKEEGRTDMAFPVAIEKPRDEKECGGGRLDRAFPDRVVVYNTPTSGRGSPNDIKWWSTLPHVRAVMGYNLAASGLTTPTTRVCIGFRRHFSLNDVRYLYLWRKVSNRRRP